MVVFDVFMTDCFECLKKQLNILYKIICFY